MKHKDDLAIDKILDCARQEFLEKGFADASMRAIAEKAGYTTGMLYGRFADKSRIFREIVAEGADELRPPTIRRPCISCSTAGWRWRFRSRPSSCTYARCCVRICRRFA